MCLDSDLFGEVIVTHDDVEIWLRNVPRLNNANRSEAASDYILNFDVVNKIKRAKLDNSFYCLNHDIIIDNQNLSNTIKKQFKAKFKSLPILPLSMHRR